MEVFVDTSAFLSILNRDDADFMGAQQIWSLLAQQRSALVTTNYVLVETFALLQNRLGKSAVHDFHYYFVPLLHVTWVDSQLQQAGITAVLAANRRRLSVVDCVSFAVCWQRNIQQVFAFDHHFTEQGFTCLTP